MKKVNKKGVVTLYIVFLIVAIMIVFIAAFAAPMGVLFNSEMFQAGEDIYLQANESIQNIQNATIREHIQGVINAGFEGAQTNIDVNGAIFQYGWILVIAVAAIVIFLFARQIVEVRGAGGGLI